MKQCLKCGYVREPTDEPPHYACPKCQAVYAKVEPLAAARERERAAISRAKATGHWSGIDPAVIKREAASVMLSTTDGIAGFATIEHVDVLAADYAYAFGSLFESVAGLARNIAGSGKSGQTIAFLREGRAEVLSALKLQALDRSADAIVGLRMDFEEFSGANNLGVIVVVATGTAVRLRRIDS